MNDREFQKELNRYAKDLEIHFDAQVRKWGVYQMRSRHFVLQGPNKPWLLFHIEDEKGNFRLPDQRDIVRVYKSVQSAHKLWDKGGDWYADKLTSQENARKAKVDAKTDDQLEWGAKEIGKQIRKGALK